MLNVVNDREARPAIINLVFQGIHKLWKLGVRFCAYLYFSSERTHHFSTGSERDSWQRQRTEGWTLSPSKREAAPPKDTVVF